MNNSEILIYQNQEGSIKIDVRLEEETVWLTQAQLCELFQKSKATISEHIIGNIDYLCSNFDSSLTEKWRNKIRENTITG